MYIFIYFFDLNFSEHRFPFVDEINIWFAAAKAMVDQGILSGSSVVYPAGLHPYGIPFIAILPTTLFGVSNINSIFFAPLVVIIFFNEFFIYDKASEMDIFILFDMFVRCFAL